MHHIDFPGIAELLEVLESHVFLPERHPEKPAVFSVDHCFSIRGQGTVMTGTLWQGTIKLNDVRNYSDKYHFLVSCT